MNMAASHNSIADSSRRPTHLPGEATQQRRRPLRALTAVLAVVLLLVGVVFTLLAGLQGSSGGYFSTSAQRFTTPTAALKSDEIEVSSDSAHAADVSPDLGDLARVRVMVAAADPTVEMFVGIGPKDEVEGYLRGSSYDEFTSAELRPFHANFQRVPGTARVESPASQAFWVATSAGAGPRTLEWNKTRGTWSIVVMRLDGEPGLDVDASIGLRFAFLLHVGIGALASAAALLTYTLAARGRPTIQEQTGETIDDDQAR